MGEKTSRIKQKGFYMPLAKDDQYVPNEFSKIKIGLQTLNDAIFEYGKYAKANKRLGDKGFVLKSISDYNLEQMR